MTSGETVSWLDVSSGEIAACSERYASYMKASVNAAVLSLRVRITW
jgi:hypothetical protein